MKELTLALMTSGEESEAECLAAVQNFRSKVAWVEIRNVFPQIKALNQMIDAVQTEFFIPLDADIVLQPDAYDRICYAIYKHRADPKWHSILFPLWDRLTEKKILALKILRSAVAKAHPFVESATPDVEHYTRLTNAGFTCIGDYLNTAPIGEHVVKGHRFCYNKYRDVYLTYRSHVKEWDPGVFMGGDTLREKAKRHFDYFLTKWVVTDNEDYLHAIAGMTDGLTTQVDHKSKSLDPTIGYRIPTKDAFGLFMKWYLEESPYADSGSMLF